MYSALGHLELLLDLIGLILDHRIGVHVVGLGLVGLAPVVAVVLVGDGGGRARGVRDVAAADDKVPELFQDLLLRLGQVEGGRVALDRVLWTARPVHGGLVTVAPRTAPTPIYEILIVFAG